MRAACMSRSGGTETGSCWCTVRWRPAPRNGTPSVSSPTRGFASWCSTGAATASRPFATGEDFLVDADDIVELMGDGAHLVAHSYGGLGAMIAAARRPDITKSLTLLEAPASVSADAAPAWQALVDEISVLWGQDIPDEEWVVRFLTAVGSDPDQFPPEMLALAVPLVPILRQGRPFYDAEVPFGELAAARFPKLVVSGGHSEAFDQMCASLARRIGAAQAVVEGAGHEIQFTGDPINQALLSVWHSVPFELMAGRVSR